MMRSLAIFLCFLLAAPLSPPLAAQSVNDRTPQVVMHTNITNAYSPGSVSPPSFADSPRIRDLIRAGNIYLSLQDAIALALENNLDIELERYGIQMAKTDTYRAQGGGTLRGVPLTVNETSAGLGGPSGSPL